MRSKSPKERCWIASPSTRLSEEVFAQARCASNINPSTPARHRCAKTWMADYAHATGRGCSGMPIRLMVGGSEPVPFGHVQVS